MKISKIISVTLLTIIFTIGLLTWPREMTTYVNLSDGYSYVKINYFLLGTRYDQSNQMFSEQFLSLMRSALSDKDHLQTKLEVGDEKVTWSFESIKRKGPDYQSLAEINNIHTEWLSNKLRDDQVIDALKSTKGKINGQAH